MLVKALVSFAGKVSMGAGETQEVSDEATLKDLLRAGYIVEVKPKAEPKAEKPKAEAVAPKEEAEKAPKKRAKRASKKK